MGKFAFHAFVFSMALLAWPAAHADSANAIMRLLNSRASGSRTEYAEAAVEVAEKAKSGSPVYGFVLALVSREQDAPAAAKMDDETRNKYLDGCRAKIKRLALEKNNSMAWYLLSLDSGDTNLLHRAADAGNIQARNAWGAFLLARSMDDGVSTNEQKRVMGIAYDHFKAAAAEGDANGLYNLGTCHAHGYGTPQDDQSAFNCFRAAAEKGHPEAINNVGWFFREGRVVEKDLEMAARWFAKSAAKENPYGQFNYGLALQRGEGVPQDLKKAAELFRIAGDHGCIEAIDAYGVALWRGEGVRENHRKAFQQFIRAANLGYPPAMENIATCYSRGTGVPADENLATEWKIRSRAARGDRNAQAWLRQNSK